MAQQRSQLHTRQCVLNRRALPPRAVGLHAAAPRRLHGQGGDRARAARRTRESERGQRHGQHPAARRGGQRADSAPPSNPTHAPRPAAPLGHVAQGVCKTLLAAGADVRAMNHQRRTPGHVASQVRAWRARSAPPLALQLCEPRPGAAPRRTRSCERLTTRVTAHRPRPGSTARTRSQRCSATGARPRMPARSPISCHLRQLPNLRERPLSRGAGALAPSGIGSLGGRVGGAGTKERERRPPAPCEPRGGAPGTQEHAAARRSMRLRWQRGAPAKRRRPAERGAGRAAPLPLSRSIALKAA